MRLLLVEDDELLVASLKKALEQQGFAVDAAFGGVDGEFMGEEEPYDLIILDLGLPGRPGLEVLHNWRQRGNKVPVIVLTARDAWHERVDGLKAGADDYLGKPFHVEELLARMLALVRRSHGAASPVLQSGGLELAVTPGAFMAANPEWTLVENVSEPGRIVVAAFTSNPVAGTFVDTFVNLHFIVNADAPAGATVINLVESADGAETQLLDESDNFLVLLPAVTNAGDDEVDGLVTIAGPANSAPSLVDPGDHSLSTSVDSMALQLDATDPDGEDSLTFSATAESAEYYLDRTIGLQLGPGGLFENWSGRLNEKWVLGDDGVTWYFITPDGHFWRWLGGDRDIAAHSEWVALLSPSAYADPSSLYEAQRGESVPAAVLVSGDRLTIDPDAGFVGTFSVLVTVTDAGGLSDSRLISLDVTADPFGTGLALTAELQAEGEGEVASRVDANPDIVELGFVDLDSRGSAKLSDDDRSVGIDAVFSAVGDTDDLLGRDPADELAGELSRE